MPAEMIAKLKMHRSCSVGTKDVFCEIQRSAGWVKMFHVSVLVLHQHKAFAQNTKSSLIRMGFSSENSYHYFKNFKRQIRYSGCRKMWGALEHMGSEASIPGRRVVKELTRCLNVWARTNASVLLLLTVLALSLCFQSFLSRKYFFNNPEDGFFKKTKRKVVPPSPMTGMSRYPNCGQVEKPVSVCWGWKKGQSALQGLRQCEGGGGSEMPLLDNKNIRLLHVA